jgi:hypothetical protein
MKNIQLTILLFMIAAISNAQISANPSVISSALPLNTRNVGIGTNTPLGGLHMLTGAGRNSNSIFILERSDLPNSNQKNKFTIGISSNMFASPTILPAGSCAFTLSNPYSISDMAFSTNQNAPQLIIKQNGNVGINTINPLHKFQVHNGAIMISGNVAGFGGPQLLFSEDITTHPNGRWAIEYLKANASTSPSMGGLNFWTPFNPGGGTGAAGNYSLFIKDDGRIGMGVTDDNGDPNYIAPTATTSVFPSGYRLYVRGGILTEKIKVAVYCSSQWADYVFAKDYKLKPLDEVEKFAKANKHLPGVPSAEDIVKSGGIDVNEMFAKQMEKIEELTLYMIEMKKEIDSLKKENTELKSSVSPIKN